MTSFGRGLSHPLSTSGKAEVGPLLIIQRALPVDGVNLRWTVTESDAKSRCSYTSSSGSLNDTLSPVYYLREVRILECCYRQKRSSVYSLLGHYDSI